MCDCVLVHSCTRRGHRQGPDSRRRGTLVVVCRPIDCRIAARVRRVRISGGLPVMVRELSPRDCFKPDRSLPFRRQCHHAGSLRPGCGGRAFCNRSGKLVPDHVHSVLECCLSRPCGPADRPVLAGRDHKPSAVYSTGYSWLGEPLATEIGALGRGGSMFWSRKPVPRILFAKPPAPGSPAVAAVGGCLGRQPRGLPNPPIVP